MSFGLWLMILQTNLIALESHHHGHLLQLDCRRLSH